MANPRTETTSMKDWEKHGWKIVPYNFPTAVVEIEPPPSLVPTDLVGDFREDTEDLEDGLKTKVKYRTQGVEGFVPYRAYRRKKPLRKK